MNAVARGLSPARARLKALRVARGLGDLDRDAGEAVLARGAGGPPEANGAASVQQGRGRKDFLALSSVLQPPGKVAEPALERRTERLRPPTATTCSLDRA